LLTLLEREVDRHSDLEARRLGGGHVEMEEHRIALQQRRDHRPGLQILACLDVARLDDTLRRSLDLRVLEIELRQLERFSRLIGVGLCRAQAGAKGFDLFAGNEPRVALAGGFATLEALLDVSRRRLCFGDRRARRADAERVTSAVDEGQRLSPFDFLPFREHHLVDHAGDTRSHLHVLESIDDARRGDRKLARLGIDVQYFDRKGRQLQTTFSPRGGSFLLLAAGTDAGQDDHHGYRRGDARQSSEPHGTPSTGKSPIAARRSSSPWRRASCAAARLISASKRDWLALKSSIALASPCL
jgi:hypothetical protein